eukprot:182628_1
MNHLHQQNDSTTGSNLMHQEPIISNNCSMYRYTAIELIGKGTFADVWKAYTIQDERKNQYALKVLQNNNKWTTPKQRNKYKQCFIHEATTIINLNNIPTTEMGKQFVIQCREILHTKTNINVLLNESNKHTQMVDVNPIIVLELCDCSLLQYIKLHEANKLRISLNTIRCISAQLFSAMSFIHGVGNCIHCDLKPENVLVNIGAIPMIKITDFGNAIFCGTNIKTFDIQTLWYRSPEVLFGHKHYFSSLIDMWSIGCILYELLTISYSNSTYQRLFKTDNLIQKICTELSRFPQYVYNKHTSYYCPNNLSSHESIYHFENSYVGLKTKRKQKLMDKLGVDAAGTNAINIVDCIDLLAGLLDLNPLTRYTSEDAIYHPFIVNDSVCKNGYVRRNHSIIKLSTDEERQNRINVQTKTFLFLTSKCKQTSDVNFAKVIMK